MRNSQCLIYTILDFSVISRSTAICSRAVRSFHTHTHVAVVAHSICDSKICTFIKSTDQINQPKKKRWREKPKSHLRIFAPKNFAVMKMRYFISSSFSLCQVFLLASIYTTYGFVGIDVSNLAENWNKFRNEKKRKKNNESSLENLAIFSLHDHFVSVICKWKPQHFEMIRKKALSERLVIWQ